jgi:cysteine desulfurase/selenocysteine lyase
MVRPMNFGESEVALTGSPSPPSTGEKVGTKGLSLRELLANESLRQHEFPVTREKVYLAHAGVCPLPRRVGAAIAAYAQEATERDQELFVWTKLTHKTKELAARLVGAQPDEIALIGPTTVGLSAVATGFPLAPGDNVLVYADDYPSNVYPWLALETRSVEVRKLQIDKLGVITAERVLAQTDARTRLVALASAHFISGYRIDLETIGGALRERDIAFCLDAIQTLGAFETSARAVDYLAADAHKWLLGPCAAGIFFARAERQAQLQPAAYGWNNILCPNYVAQSELVFRKGAQKFEAGTANLLGMVGLAAALELLLEVGVADIAAELQRKYAWFAPALREKGYQLLNAGEPLSRQSGIFSIYRPGESLQPLHRKLEQAHVITSLRTDRLGQQYVRMSPHFYNTDAELTRVLELL